MSLMLYYYFNSNIMVIILHFFFLNFFFNDLSLNMVFLTFILMKIIMYSSKMKFFFYSFKFNNLFLKMIFFFCFMFFFSDSLMEFYMFFEVVSLLIFFQIYLSSFSSMRLKASVYIFFFMNLGTLPMLVMIYFLNEKTFLLIFFLSFLIKIPIIFFHLWLPKAHVEANFYDSMILASLLLKLGSYGIIMMEMKLNFFFFLSVMSTIMFSFMILFLLDMKMILAFSSVIHMNLLLLVLLSNNILVEMIFFLSMLSHGLISSLMFFLIGMIYEQSFSRLIHLNKSMFLNFPVLYIFFFFTFLINMSIPPFLTFFSEFYIFIELMNFSLNYYLISVLLILLMAFFNIIFLKNFGMMNLMKFFKMYNFKIGLMIILFEHLFMMVYLI